MTKVESLCPTRQTPKTVAIEDILLEALEGIYVME